MAVPILIRKTNLAAKVEAVEGTAQTLALADGLRISNLNFEPSIDSVKRSITDNSLSRFKNLPGKRNGNMSFDVELKGSGTNNVPPEWGEIMKACGFGETIGVSPLNVVYKPISTGIPSMTLAGFMDGINKTIFGARGNLTMEMETGQPAKIGFSFQGSDFTVADNSGADDTLVAGIVYDTTTPSIVLGVTMTLDGFSFKISKLNFDLGNEISLRDDMSASSGNFSALIGERNSSGSFDPELMKPSDYDIYSKWKSGSEAALQIIIGTAAGNIWTIDAPKVMYTSVAGSERGILRSLDVGFDLNRNAGDDELVFTQT